MNIVESDDYHYCGGLARLYEMIGGSVDAATCPTLGCKGQPTPSGQS
ncbi:hypothetical protein ACKUB1_09530 [Methanospirillum stamsii]|nr:hypothetical protein [Methanospirillum stamsii]